MCKVPLTLPNFRLNYFCIDVRSRLFPTLHDFRHHGKVSFDLINTRFLHQFANHPFEHLKFVDQWIGKEQTPELVNSVMESYNGLKDDYIQTNAINMFLTHVHSEVEMDADKIGGATKQDIESKKQEIRRLEEKFDGIVPKVAEGFTMLEAGRVQLNEYEAEIVKCEQSFKFAQDNSAFLMTTDTGESRLAQDVR